MPKHMPGKHVLRHVPVRHMLGHVLKHGPSHVLKHVPDRHVLEHVPRYVFENVPQNRHHDLNAVNCGQKTVCMASFKVTNY